MCISQMGIFYVHQSDRYFLGRDGGREGVREKRFYHECSIFYHHFVFNSLLNCSLCYLLGW